MPAELMKRSFNGSPPPGLSEQIQCACLRVPLEREQFLWSVFRNLPPDAGVQLVRAWLLQHNPEEISRMERAVTHVHTAKGEHAAALDIMRWAESKDLSVQRADADRWKGLYFRVLRNTAEERASSVKRAGSFGNSSLDMGTPQLQAGDCPPQLAQYRFYRTQLTGLEVPLRNITQSEALILRQYLGDQQQDEPAQGDEREALRQHARVQASRPRQGEMGTHTWESAGPQLIASQLIAADPYAGQARLGPWTMPPLTPPLVSKTVPLDACAQAQVRAEDHAERARALASIGTAAHGGADAVDCSDAGAIAANGMLSRGPDLTNPKSSDEDPKHAVMGEGTYLQSVTSARTSLSQLAERGEMDREPTSTAGVDQQMPTGGESPSERMFTPQQLELALRTIDELQMTRVPETLQDEAWPHYVHTLFLREGWRHMSSRYGQSVDAHLTKQMLVADLDSLRPEMTMDRGLISHGSPVDGGRQNAQSVQWLAELVGKHLPDLSEQDMQETHTLADRLVVEIGQSTLWMHGFAPLLHEHNGISESYFSASPVAQSAFKMAFMQAADTYLGAQRGQIGGASPDGGVIVHGSADRMPLRAVNSNRHGGVCHNVLKSDPEAALFMAQQILKEAPGSDDDDHRVGLLHLVISDAFFGLQQYSQVVPHFQRYAGVMTPQMQLPLDSFLEYICSLLLEGFPAAQVLQATEESCPPDGRAQDWILLVKVLAEMMDVDDAMEQAQDEENRHMVNKLLMLLGNNVTNKRERDARMQRCLQEGGDAAAERDNNGARRAGSSRRTRTEEGSDIDIQKLQEFWASLPPSERPALCSVTLKDLDKAVQQLCATVAERDAPRDASARSHTPASSEADTSSRSDTLLQQLHSRFVDLESGDAHFGLSDALCDIKSLSMASQAPNKLVQAPDVLGADASAPARSLFCIIGDRVALNQAMPLEGVLLSSSGDAVESQDASDASAASREAGTLVLTEPVGDESSADDSAALLKRLLAIEASFELDFVGKGQPKMDLGPQITFQQVLTVVRIASTVHQAGALLPHARRALGELCRRLLRKEPMRAVMTAQRALLAQLARLMLRGVRTAFGEEQQKLKKEEAERAEQELLEALEAEDSKLKDEGKKRAKKKKSKRTGLGDGVVAELGADVPVEDAHAIPGAFAGWDDAAAIASEALVAAERDLAAVAQASRNGGADDDHDHAATLSASDHNDMEDSAARDAREAADALRIVEAAEAAEAAAAAMAAESATKAAEQRQTWEEVPQRRRHRKDRTLEAPDGEAGDVTSKGKGRLESDGDAVSGHADGSRATGSEPVTDEGLEKGSSDTSPGKPDGSDEENGVDTASAHAADVLASGVVNTTHARQANTSGNSKSSSAGDHGVAAANGKRPRRPKANQSEREDGHQSNSNSSEHGAGNGSSGKRKGKVVANNTVIEDEAVAMGVAAAPGLENKTGQHSCFVNVVVQTLWNVSAFRDAFLVCEPHKDARGEDSSIFLAMKQVCSMMEDGAAAAAADTSHGKPQQATASALKEALFRLDSSFELGEMHDATEAHEALLEALHRAQAPPRPVAATADGAARAGASVAGSSTAPAACNGPSHEPGPAAQANGASESVRALSDVLADQGGSADSFVKRIFSMSMRMEYSRPSNPKEEHSKPVNFDQWTQYVVASELRKQVREAAGGATSPLVRVLRMAAGSEADSSPGKETGQPAPGCNKLHMLRTPRVFTLGLASDTAHASKAEISESLQGIDERIHLSDVYEGLEQGGSCQLVALTAFYEQHYVCFCYSQVAGQWIHYDDDTRRLVGKDFDAVKDKCVAGRLHPQLLFYESRQ